MAVGDRRVDEVSSARDLTLLPACLRRAVIFSGPFRPVRELGLNEVSN